MPDLDELTTEVFNAVGTARWPDAYEPVDCFADLEGDGLPEAMEEWKLIRLALEKMPHDVLIELCKQRGQLNIIRALRL
jgi:hypothetical protein